MTRKKVKLAFITNDSARKATYKKRKRGLLKKMDELTTLCDVKACAVLYSPYETRPVVWPGPSGARDVIASFKRLPEMEKVKKMVSQEEFLRQRVAKAHEQLKKQQKENKEKEITHVMYQCLSGKGLHNLSLLDLSDLGWVINQRLLEINKKSEILKIENNPSNNNNNNVGGSPTSGPQEQPAQGPGEIQGQKGNFDAMHMQMMMQQPWSSFMDMMAPTTTHDHHPQHVQYHAHHQLNMGMDMGMGMGMGMGSSNNGLNGKGENSNGSSNIMMMMMGQFGEYHHGHPVNSALWSNAFMG